MSCRDSFAGGNFVGGRFRHPWKSQSCNRLTHTLTCQPMLRSESKRSTNQIATESSSSSQHLKESAVPNHCPKAMDSWNAVPLASSHCPADTPILRYRKFSPPFLQMIFHEIIPPRHAPQPLACACLNLYPCALTSVQMPKPRAQRSVHNAAQHKTRIKHAAARRQMHHTTARIENVWSFSGLDTQE